MHTGPWTIVDATTLAQRPRLAPGQLLRHRSGNVVLNCPACNATQFVVAQLAGPSDAPTLSCDVTCGAGYCKRCALRFTIVGGRTVVRSGPLGPPRG